MDDLTQKLNEVLASPEKLEQVMQMAGALMGSKSEQSPDSAPPALPSAAPSVSSGASTGSSASSTSAGGLDLSALAKLDPKILSALGGVLGSLGREDDKTALMRALKPHLCAERAERVDRAVKILQISGAVRAAMGAMKGGNSDV